MSKPGRNSGECNTLELTTLVEFVCDSREHDSSEASCTEGELVKPDNCLGLRCPRALSWRGETCGEIDCISTLIGLLIPSLRGVCGIRIFWNDIFWNE